MFDFLIFPKNGDPSFGLTADSNHICEWEAKNRLNSLTSLQENTRMTELRIIAHIACKRTGILSGSLEEFIENYRIEFKDKVRSLDKDELTHAISVAMLSSSAPEDLADAVMDFMEALGRRGVDPTRPAQ